jgi:hypothetical protein
MTVSFGSFVRPCTILGYRILKSLLLRERRCTVPPSCKPQFGTVELQLIRPVGRIVGKVIGSEQQHRLDKPRLGSWHHLSLNGRRRLLNRRDFVVVPYGAMWIDMRVIPRCSARSFGIHPGWDDSRYVAEPKFDGQRAQVHVAGNPPAEWPAAAPRLRSLARIRPRQHSALGPDHPIRAWAADRARASCSIAAITMADRRSVLTPVVPTGRPRTEGRGRCPNVSSNRVRIASLRQSGSSPRSGSDSE